MKVPPKFSSERRSFVFRPPAIGRLFQQYIPGGQSHSAVSPGKLWSVPLSLSNSRSLSTVVGQYSNRRMVAEEKKKGVLRLQARDGAGSLRSIIRPTPPYRMPGIPAKEMLHGCSVTCESEVLDLDLRRCMCDISTDTGLAPVTI